MCGYQLLTVFDCVIRSGSIYYLSRTIPSLFALLPISVVHHVCAQWYGRMICVRFSFQSCSYSFIRFCWQINFLDPFKLLLHPVISNCNIVMFSTWYCIALPTVYSHERRIAVIIQQSLLCVQSVT